MIWIVLIIAALATLLILAPAFVGPVETDSGELTEYFEQLDALEGRDDLDSDTKASAKLALERQILKAETADTGGGGRVLAFIAAIALLGGGAAIYSVVGHPESLVQRVSEEDSLLRQLEARPAMDRADDPLGWMLYTWAYDRALALQDDPAFHAEAEALLRVLSQEDIAAAMDMTEADRAVMIRGMVDGLAVRFAENSQDAPGWTRLICTDCAG